MSKEGNALARVLEYYKLIPDFSKLQKIVCPFHKDVNPSMVVDLDKGKWFCFGCQLSGDAPKFVELMEAKYHKLNSFEAYKKYMQILKTSGISDIELSKYQKAARPPKKELYAQAYDFYHGLKREDWREFLKAIGECNDKDKIKAVQYMLDRGFTSKVLTKAGMRYTYSNPYPVVFPMMDNGKFKGWVCRTNDPEVAKKRKYLYNKGFSRATTLVGDYGSKNYVFVVEGYMDRLKFVQFGVDNVVAILGWKVTSDQIRKLKAEGIKYIISALDNDDCGKKGTLFLKQHFKVVRFAYLKGIKDAGEMDEKLFKKMLNKTKQRMLENGIEFQEEK